MDDSAFHIFLLDSARKPLACGVWIFTPLAVAQVRFMAVDENARAVTATGVAFSRDWRPRQRVAALKKLVLKCA